jgi:hypothetical protein
MRSRLRLALPALVALGLTMSCGDDDSGGGDSGGDADGGDAPTADAAPLGAYESFVRSSSAGPCAEDTDCFGSTELTADRVLLVDRFGELPVVIHQAEVTPEELDAAVAVFTDRDLVALLDLGEPPCVPPSDIDEQMTLFAGGAQHSNSVTLCEDPPLEAARAALDDLAATYFPEATR